MKLAEAGARLAVNYLTNDAAAEDLANKLSGDGCQMILVKGDVIKHRRLKSQSIRQSPTSARSTSRQRRR